ncbi:conserved Plasmodium protein, unknown function [Plasmodium knowlesi strain H]|uniref:Uncharacterized protein n=3 Tax=Plasmodium knowlesi TaxID=5850 RepID=A0A5K1U328_PLAKH|nr:conserved Plasmodium protein, unknown function [Plasmodium knowlesi strain H]OTN68287.1 Uncharacterized protein PKNOH_S03323000 [Plasmodium knowlesi]CAA9987132.1 conserved Plasmodium protein, unknown function [Plasmodium knowlesi strain H]SBO23884.1 conserved Plasmodium protein, unknown function [Plasmodium knowlesi strain H]SBO25710.1 conserved Plasmodium protein, unknown function [Plasmodium knowlesi strain H]VVS76606.1 conserved Plasmodium protein, unknown function [Plasmodium knowlesi s|eukprot:XP_002261754.1 hypothetical protein, conserved in Plasmodium species [Plasmodium knowlesi strain H]
MVPPSEAPEGVGFKEELVKCSEQEKCEYKTNIKVKIGNNQKILLLVRHKKEEFYVVLHQTKFIVAYPMVYKTLAPQKSIFSYKEFYELGIGTIDEQNKKGKDRCESYDFSIHEQIKVPTFEGFNDRPFSLCCSCYDLPHSYESINDLYKAVPQKSVLECPDRDTIIRNQKYERLVSVKKALRHVLPMYALFKFKNDVNIFLIFNITVMKKKKTFSDYFQLYSDKADLEKKTYRYVISESAKPIELFDEKYIYITHSSSAFDNVSIPTLHNNYLLYPFYPEELYGIKYGTLDYGCSYNKSLNFECIENDENKCTYTDSTCLSRSILIPKNYVADDTDSACGLIGYNDYTVSRRESCMEDADCISNTVESYVNKAQELTKGNEETVTKLPIINGKYPHYIFRKKNYNQSTLDKRTVKFFQDNNIEHFIAYEYYKEDRTEFTISLFNHEKDHVMHVVDSPVSSVKNEHDGKNRHDGKSEQEPLEEPEPLYDDTIFQLETLNELRIINILYSDQCDEQNTQKCGVLVHVWNPSMEQIKARLKLQCTINSSEKYIDEKNLIYDEGQYQFLFFFKVPFLKFPSLRNCSVHAYGAFKLYDTQTYVVRKRGIIRKFFYHQPKETSAMKVYSEGIQKVTCCMEEPHICDVKNIPHCITQESLNVLHVFIFLVFLVFVFVVFLTGNARKKRTDSNSAGADNTPST